MIALRRRGPLLLAVVLTLILAGIGTIGVERKVASFQPLGFLYQAHSGNAEVESVLSPATGLKTGDKILLVNGTAFSDVGNLARALSRHSQSHLAVLRQGSLEEITYHLPPLVIDYPYLVLALVGIGYLLIGFFTVLRDQNRPALLFFSWAFASATVYILSPVGPFDLMARVTYLVEEVARLLLPPLTLHLFLVFPSTWSRRRDLVRKIIPFLYLPAAFLMTLQADLVITGGQIFFGGHLTRHLLASLDRLELDHLALYALAAIAIVVSRLRTTRHWEQHRQVAWIAVGLTAGYLPFLGLYVLPHALHLRWPELLTTVAVIPLALVPLTFAYAILRYKLWDLGVMVRDTLSLTLTLLIGVLGFSLVNLVISRGISAEHLVARNLLSFVAGLAIAGVLVPTRHGIGRSLERLQYGPAYTRRKALSRFAREIVHERGLDRLCGLLLDQLSNSLEVSPVNLLLAQGNSLIPVRPGTGVPAQVPLGAFAPGFWTRDIARISGVGLPSAELSVAQRLFASGFRYAFPLTFQEQQVGVLLTGLREGEAPLNSDDEELIRNLLSQTVLAIENARLLDQVHRQLDEVVRLQQHNQGIIESSPAGIAVLDSENRVVSANLAFAALAGIERPQTIGHPLAELLPMHPLPRPEDGMLDVSYCDAEGTERHLQISVARLRGGEPERQRVLVVQDVSDRVAMEQALQEKDRLAALGMLAAGVAHEVNTPLTGISSYAQMLLAETAQDDPRFEILKKVERQSFRASQIVNSLLDFARHPQRAARDVDLVTLVDECLELTEERRRANAVTLDWQRPGQPIVVGGDEGELQQVLTNLVLNAIDAMAGSERQPRTLRVTIEGGGEKATVVVEDNGKGVSPQDLERIFEPFYSTKLGSGGTGLGLSVSHRIVERHGGRLIAASELGAGSRFTLELPRSQESQGSEPPQ